MSSIKLFHTAAGTAFPDLQPRVEKSGRSRSRRFRPWLQRRHCEATGDAERGIRLSICFEARARFDLPKDGVIGRQLVDS